MPDAGDRLRGVRLRESKYLKYESQLIPRWILSSRYLIVCTVRASNQKPVTSPTLQSQL